MNTQRKLFTRRMLVLLLGLLLAISASAQTKPYDGTASCNDVVDGDISARVVWASDIQGPLGIGAAVPFNLNAGIHVISGTCADAAGNAASQSVTINVVLTDTEPPVLGIDVQPVQTSQNLTVSPDAAIVGAFGLKVTPREGGGAIYIGKPEGLTGLNPVADWGDHLIATIEVRTTDAALADGFEMVIMRGADTTKQPLFDLILVGTAAQPEVVARVHEASGPLTTPAVALVQDTNKLGVEWSQHATLGLVRLFVNDIQQGEIVGLDTDTELKWLLIGAPESTEGLEGFLAIDEVLARPVA